jgi:hypothetical protein
MKNKFLRKEQSEFLGWVSVGSLPGAAPRHLFRHQLAPQVKLVPYGRRRSLTLIPEIVLRPALERPGTNKGDGVQDIDNQAAVGR